MRFCTVFAISFSLSGCSEKKGANQEVTTVSTTSVPSTVPSTVTETVTTQTVAAAPVKLSPVTIIVESLGMSMTLTDSEHPAYQVSGRGITTRYLVRRAVDFGTPSTYTFKMDREALPSEGDSILIAKLNYDPRGLADGIPFMLI